MDAAKKLPLHTSVSLPESFSRLIALPPSVPKKVSPESHPTTLLVPESFWRIGSTSIAPSATLLRYLALSSTGSIFSFRTGCLPPLLFYCKAVENSTKILRFIQFFIVNPIQPFFKHWRHIPNRPFLKRIFKIGNFNKLCKWKASAFIAQIQIILPCRFPILL